MRFLGTTLGERPLNGEAQHSLSSAQLEEFSSRGLLRIRQVIERDVALELQSQLWERLAIAGIRPGVPQSWQALSEEHLGEHIKRTRKMKGMRAIYNDKSKAIASTMLSTRDVCNDTKPLLLLTFPGKHTYIDQARVPSTLWHTDTPFLPNGVAYGVILLVFLNRVSTGGGGTMVVAGSHRLFEQSESIVRSKVAKRRLKQYPFFRDLFDKRLSNRELFLNREDCVRNVNVQVVELVGEPGDAVFVHGSCLHTLVRNFRDEPRMMVRGFFQNPALSPYGSQAAAVK